MVALSIAGSFDEESHADEFVVVLGTILLIFVEGGAIFFIWLQFPS